MSQKVHYDTQFPLYYRKMSSPEIGEAVRTIKMVIIPVGSTEPHGYHLPVDTDLTTIEYLAEKSVIEARKRSSKTIAVIAPSLPYGTTLEMDWPGHVFLRPTTQIELLNDVGDCFAKMGFRFVLFLNGCGGNIDSINVAVNMMKARWRKKGNFIVVGSVWASPESIVRDSGPGGVGHACEIETSTELYLDHEHVQMDKAVNEHMCHPSPLISLDFNGAQPFNWPVHFSTITKSGVIGDAKLATAEKGKKILDANINRIAEILLHLDGLT
jgi:creatinine amidohydrolase